MLPSSVNSLLLHIGLPASLDGMRDFQKEGGKVIFVLKPSERDGFTLPDGMAGLTWSSDEAVKNWLFENMAAWKGCTIGGLIEEDMQKFTKLLCELVDLQNFDTDSMKFLTKDQTPTKNALRNYRYVEDGIPLARAKGHGKNATAYVIAAGPSLDKQWDELRRIREGDPTACFIVAGRSYKEAMRRGVIPQFVVEVEQFDWDDRIFMFAPEPPPETILAFPLMVCPGVPKAWPAQHMVMMDHNTALLFGLKVREESIDGGNSILHHMVNLAVWLGCEQVCLAGADLGYPDGYKAKTHAEGTFHPWPGDILKQEHLHQTPMEAVSNDGTAMQSSPPYLNFRLFLELQIHRAKEKRAGLKFWNFSPRGQKVAGAEYTPIEKWSSPCLKPSPPLPASSPSESAPASPSSSGST